MISLDKDTGKSRFKIILGHGTPLEACDQFVLTREIIGGVVRRYRLDGTENKCMVSYVPKHHAEEEGNAVHIHMSLWKDGKNVFGDKGGSNGMSAQGEQFVSGIYESLPALMN